MTGSVQADPSSITDATSELFASIDLAFKGTFDAVMGANLPIAGTDLAPFVPPLGAVTKVRAFALRAVEGESLVVKLTSAAGTDQALPVSGVLVVRVANTGDELTAIKVVGTGRIEYLLAGNKT